MSIGVFKKIVEDAKGKPITIKYTNWKGMLEERVISPQEFSFMKTIWHTDEQWCVLAWCHLRQAERVFVVCDIQEATC